MPHRSFDNVEFERATHKISLLMKFDLTLPSHFHVSLANLTPSCSLNNTIKLASLENVIKNPFGLSVALSLTRSSQTISYANFSYPSISIRASIMYDGVWFVEFTKMSKKIAWRMKGKRKSTPHVAWSEYAFYCRNISEISCNIKLNNDWT